MMPVGGNLSVGSALLIGDDEHGGAAGRVLHRRMSRSCIETVGAGRRFQDPKLVGPA